MHRSPGSGKDINAIVGVTVLLAFHVVCLIDSLPVYLLSAASGEVEEDKPEELGARGAEARCEHRDAQGASMWGW